MSDFFQKYFFLVFVFVTGGVIMMVEIAAIRLMTPYFGASLFVWAGVLGLFMIALSLGYYAGGKLADRHPRRKVLMGIVLAAGGLLGLVPFMFQLTLPYFVQGLGGGSPLFGSLIVSSLAFSHLLFLTPVTLLGMVSPFVIRLVIRELEETGGTAGSVYAFSTVGSVAGTFVSSFVTIPLLGVKEALLISALCLLLVGFLGLLPGLKKSSLALASVLLAGVVVILVALTYAPVRKRANVLHHKDSFYGTVEVLKDERLGHVLDINRSGRFSVYHPENIITHMYFDYFSPIYFLLEEGRGKEVLVLGHAGGVISRQYTTFFGSDGVRIDGVELDPEVTRAAYQFFDLGSQRGVSVINEDGRIFLQQTSKKYDLILSDVYMGGLYIPHQLASREFYELSRARLRQGGIFAQMVLAHKPDGRVLRCVGQTIRSVYPHSYVYPSGTKQEYLLLGSNAPLKGKLARLGERADVAELQDINSYIAREAREVVPEKRPCIFTDNRAPTEFLQEIDKMTHIYRFLATGWQKLGL